MYCMDWGWLLVNTSGSAARSKALFFRRNK
jgi:hypothetical protein